MGTAKEKQIMISAVAALPDNVHGILSKVVKPKFNAYFAFTAGGKRSVPVAGSQPRFVYPNDTMASDLVFLWSIFSDVYEVVGGPKSFAELVKSDTELYLDARRIVEGASSDDPDGSFWHFPTGQVSLEDASGPQLSKVMRTLRNGFAHSRWFYADLSAIDYWKELRWDVTKADSRFNLTNRPRNNYTIYIADATVPWDPENFWEMPDLRILITHSSILRYHLHLMLNYILNGSRDDVFNY